ncbi:GNAT family N-acetyltransferase [Rhodobacteraceae bacterium WD3A24]|nr:GNAT family N-acetyltransferase [Rhodobacteraceae bacterium WD3A24]
MEATWPPLSARRVGRWTIRAGGGGGKRVSAATAAGPVTSADIGQAEAAMRALGQRPLFMLRPGEEALDATLADHGYARTGATVFYRAPAASVAGGRLPRLSAFPHWPPLAVMADLWAETGHDAARRAVMGRVGPPRTALLARQDDRAAGAGFVAARGDIAMLHALAVPLSMRRRGVGRGLLRAAAHWAMANRAVWLALAATRDNTPAQALFVSVGMEPVEGYHYRRCPERPY